MTGMVFVFQVFFDRFDANIRYLTYEDVADRYDRSVIKFNSGKNKLMGYLYGEQNKKGLVVIAHGLGGGAENYLAETLYFVDRGWRVFAYDCTGSFGSEGNLSGFPQAVYDLEAALQYIRNDRSLKDLPLLLYGHSMGGYAVTSVLRDSYTIEAVVSVSGFNSPTEVMVDRASQYIGVLAYLEAPYVWVYQTLLFGKDASLQAIDGINHSDTPVMIIHGDKDRSVTYGGSGIIAYRDSISNPKVTYMICNTSPCNDHKNLYVSEAAYQYRKEIREGFQKLTGSYHRRIPEDIKSDYYDAIDVWKASELNLEFMDSVNRFYEGSLEQSYVTNMMKR
jgi:pimeloyl-ACP methyl ester carboxylesterase